MNEELQDALANRAETYGVLARCFAAELDGPAVAWFGGLESGGNENLASMVAFVQSGATADEVVTALAVDYAHLFIVRSKDETQAAYPTESVYASPEQTTVSDARDAVKALYRASGLVVDGSALAEDHIAIELSYMRLLAERILARAQANDEEGYEAAVAASLAFLSDHLGKWAPYFAGRVQKGARTPFYRGLGAFLADFLADDLALMDGLARGLLGAYH